MQIPPEEGQLMAFLVKLIQAKRTIEIGVYTGYSALCVAQALPDDGHMVTWSHGHIVACDVNEEWANIAQKYWHEAQVANKISLKIAPAVNTLKALLDKGEADSYDFIFIDADKGSYAEYYELSLNLLRPGGLMAIDNVLLFGSVVDSRLLDESLKKVLSETDIQAVRDLNIKIQADKRVDISMLPVADGITLLRKL